MATTSPLSIRIHTGNTKEAQPQRHLNASEEGDIPNEETIAAIEEGWRIAHDPNAKSYDSIAELRKALGV